MAGVLIEWQSIMRVRIVCSHEAASRTLVLIFKMHDDAFRPNLRCHPSQKTRKALKAQKMTHSTPPSPKETQNEAQPSCRGVLGQTCGTVSQAPISIGE
eukprot:6465037-Amphidinium_carterae.2